MIEIKLTKGKVAIIDDVDAHLAIHKWWATGPRCGVYYATRHEGSRKNRRVIYLHREIMGFPAERIDHEDGDGLNCRRSNLRTTTHKANLQNRGLAANNASGFTGVCWHKGEGKWRAVLTVSGKQKSLGYYTSVDEARKARALGEIEEIGIRPRREKELRDALGSAWWDAVALRHVLTKGTDQ